MKRILSFVTLIIMFSFLLLPFMVSAKEFSNGQYVLYGDLDLEPVESEGLSCESIFIKNGEYNSLYYALQDAFSLIKFVVPVLILVLSSMDYIKAITSHDAEGLKKANTRFVKRLAIGIIIFLLPFLLDFTFEAFGLYDLGTCGVGK